MSQRPFGPWSLVAVLVCAGLAFGCGGGDAGASVDAGGGGQDGPPGVSLSFGDPILDPTGNAPLAAEIGMRAPGEGAVTVSVAGRSPADAPFEATLSFSAAGEEVNVPVLGLYPAHDNEVTLTVVTAEGVKLGSRVWTITTGPLPEGLPTIEVSGTHDETQFTFLPWLLTPMARADGLALMIDRRGQVRWYSTFPIPRLHPTEIFEGTIYAGDGGSLLLRYDFLGRELLRFDFSAHGYERIHHDIYRKPSDGHLLLTVDRSGDPFIEDRVIEVDVGRETLRARWNLADVLPDVADLFHDLPLTSGDDPGLSNDPVHINALWYDDEDDTLIVCSQRTGVAEVYRSGQLKWLLAPHLQRHVDDADGDGVSDSLADGYDPELLLSRVGDYRGSAYTDLRYPVSGEPVVDYSGFVFDYGEFLLSPLDAAGDPIEDDDVRRGFADHADFGWPFRPHAPMLLENGNLLVFDNGLGRHFTVPFTPQSYSRAVEYAIEEDPTDGFGGTVRQVWEYRIPADPAWHGMSALVSDVDELPNGNRLVTSGAIGSSFLIGTPLGDYGDGPHGARIVEVDPADDRVVHELRLQRVLSEDAPLTEFSVYRSERVDPYAAWKAAPLGSE